jgi:hypothetical protein
MQNSCKSFLLLLNLQSILNFDAKLILHNSSYLQSILTFDANLILHNPS